MKTYACVLLLFVGGCHFRLFDFADKPAAIPTYAMPGGGPGTPADLPAIVPWYADGETMSIIGGGVFVAGAAVLRKWHRGRRRTD